MAEHGQGRIRVFVNQLQYTAYQPMGAAGFWSIDAWMGPWPQLALRDAVARKDFATANAITVEISRRTAAATRIRHGGKRRRRLRCATPATSIPVRCGRLLSKCLPEVDEAQKKRVDNWQKLCEKYKPSRRKSKVRPGRGLIDASAKGRRIKNKSWGGAVMVFGAMFSRLLLLALCLLISLSPGVQAQDVAEFYRGKTLNIVLGVAPGGGYDQNARLVSRVHRKVHSRAIRRSSSSIWGRPIRFPRPTTSITSRRRTARRSGPARALRPIEPLWGNSNAKFDVTKLRWLGSTASDNGVVVVWHTAPHKTADDLFKTELVTGATAPGGDTYLYPNALNKLLGTKFKLVSGYPNQAPIALAMERGEVEGSGNWSWSSIGLAYPQWLTEKKVRILMQLGLERHRDLPDVPLVMDYAKTDEQREILRILMGMKKFGYPFFIPPGVPQDRADALDQAFQKMLKDPELSGGSQAAESRYRHGDRRGNDRGHQPRLCLAAGRHPESARDRRPEMSERSAASVQDQRI